MTYKKMIESTISFNVYCQVSDKTNGTVTIKNMNTDTSEKDTISFNCLVNVCDKYNSREYRVSGYMSEYGKVYICLVFFDRFYSTENHDTNRKSYFIHGNDLENFKFNI